MANVLGWRSRPIDWVGNRPLVDRVDPMESARVQAMRGIACLLLVAFHTVGSSAASGLRVPDDSLYRQFTNLFVHLRMPLFTFLSGFIYGLRPLRPGQAVAFSGKKLRRLGVPLLVASTLLYCLHAAAHHPVPPGMWTIYVFPYWHLWFVQALLVVFAVVVVLESIGALSTFTGFAAVVALALALYFHGPFGTLNVFGVYNAAYLLPFFLCGLAAHRYRDVLQSRRALIATVLCFVLTQGFHSYIVLTRTLPPIEPVDHRSALNLAIGMSASLCALQLLPRMPLVERIGGFSYPIYLYHPLFVAAVLSVAAAASVDARGLVFTVACIAGVAGPIAMGLVARRVPGGQLLLEGRLSARARREEIRVVLEPVPAKPLQPG